MLQPPTCLEFPKPDSSDAVASLSLLQGSTSTQVPVLAHDKAMGGKPLLSETVFVVVVAVGDDHHSLGGKPQLIVTIEWMFGCLDVWMFGCLDVWMFGCSDVAHRRRDTRVGVPRGLRGPPPPTEEEEDLDVFHSTSSTRLG